MNLLIILLCVYFVTNTMVTCYIVGMFHGMEETLDWWQLTKLFMYGSLIFFKNLR